MTHVEEVPGNLLTLSSEHLELLKESMREILRGLDGGMGSSTEGRVDLCRLVDHILDNRLGRLDEGSDALFR